jgi:hypothetical protein
MSRAREELVRIAEGVAWEAVPPELVDIGKCYPTKRELEVANLIALGRFGGEIEGDPFPHLVGLDGLLYIVDGHARIAVWFIRGLRLAPARVFRVKRERDA